jgi:hypothetical protein
MWIMAGGTFDIRLWFPGKNPSCPDTGIELHIGFLKIAGATLGIGIDPPYPGSA